MCERAVLVLVLALCLFSQSTAQDHEGGEVEDPELQQERKRLDALALELEEERRLQQGQEGDGAIPGQPEQDYPVFSRVPQTSFTCTDKHVPGYFADIETRCQAFHICDAGGTKHSFLCPGGSVFNQKYLVCDWWYGSVCEDSPLLYEDQRELARLYQHTSRQEQQNVLTEEAFVDEQDHNYIFPQSDIFHSAETGVPNRDKFADLGEHQSNPLGSEQGDKSQNGNETLQESTSGQHTNENLPAESLNYRLEKRKLQRNSFRRTKFDERTNQKEHFRPSDYGFSSSTEQVESK